MSIHKIDDRRKTTEAKIQPKLVSTLIRVLDRIGFFCLLTVIVLVVIPYGTVDAWWEAAFECAIFGLTAMWILESLLRGSWEIHRVFVIVPMFLLTAYAFLQTAHLPFLIAPGDGPLPRRSLTIDEYQTHLTAVKILVLTLCAMLLLQRVNTTSRLKWVVRVIIGIALGSALFGIARQVLQAPTSTSGFVLPFLFPGLGYGQFLSSNAFAFVVEMGFALVLGLILGGGVARQHILLYVVAGVIIWTALVLANSRGGLIGFICETVFLLVMAYPRFAQRFERDVDGRPRIFGVIPPVLVKGVAVLAIVVGLTFSVVWMGGQELATKMAQGEGVVEPEAGTTRTQIWSSTWQLIKHRPLTGVGFGTYFLAIPQFQTGSGRLKLEQAHNDYLDLAANGGLIAVLIALCFVGLVVWRARASLKSGDSFRRAAALGAIAALISVAVHSFVDFGLQVTGIAVIALAMTVIAVVDVRSSAQTIRISRMEE